MIFRAQLEINKARFVIKMVTGLNDILSSAGNNRARHIIVIVTRLI